MLGKIDLLDPMDIQFLSMLGVTMSYRKEVLSSCEQDLVALVLHITRSYTSTSDKRLEIAHAKVRNITGSRKYNFCATADFGKFISIRYKMINQVTSFKSLPDSRSGAVRRGLAFNNEEVAIRVLSASMPQILLYGSHPPRANSHAGTTP